MSGKRTLRNQKVVGLTNQPSKKVTAKSNSKIQKQGKGDKILDNENKT